MYGRIWKSCLALALPVVALGCGASSGFLRDSMTQTQIRGPGFRIVKTGLSASAQTGSVFCSIPTDEGQVYRRAMELLNAEAKLLPNQMLVNIREDLRVTAYLVFYCKQILTLSADIIEFGAGGHSAAPTEVQPPRPDVAPPQPPPPAAGMVAPPPPPPAAPAAAGTTPARQPR